MEDRIVAFRAVAQAKMSSCCLDSIQDNRHLLPVRNFECGICGNFLKVFWLDFTVSKNYGIAASEQKYRKEDFLGLSAIVRRRFTDTSEQLREKFVDLKDVVKKGLDEAEISDTERGREYIFNKNIEVEEIMVITPADDVFILLGKSSDLAAEGNNVSGVTFAFGGGGRGRKANITSIAANGGELDLNPQVRTA